MTANSPTRVRWLRALLLLCLAVSVFSVAYPMYVIRPFRAQGASELTVALWVARFRPALTVISAIVAVAIVMLYRGRRILPILGAVLACVLAYLARVNVYELMFHPIEKASFSSALQAKLDQDEKVIAVQIGGQARAYPIRSMSYHHLINDVVDKLAIVATY